MGTWGWEERLGRKGHGSVYIPDLGQRRDRNVRENGQVTVTQETEAQHPLSLLFWGFLDLGTHTSTPCSFADTYSASFLKPMARRLWGSRWCLSRHGCSKGQAGEREHSHYSEGDWLPLGDAQDPWRLMAARPRPTLSPRRE